MSSVSSIILTHSICENSHEDADGHDVFPIHAQLNAFFGEARGLVSVADRSLPFGWYGGGKALQMEVLIGAFNHMDEDAFLSHVAALPWEEPEAVTITLLPEQAVAPDLYRGRAGGGLRDCQRQAVWRPDEDLIPESYGGNHVVLSIRPSEWVRR